MAAGLVAAVYVYFLLFAGFSFVESVRAVLGTAGAERPILALLGAGGVCGSLLGARLGQRVGPHYVLQIGLTGCALCAAAAAWLPLTGSWAFGAAALCIGSNLGASTVALAAQLENLAGVGRVGLAVGLGTGVAYAVCNVPPLFLAGSEAHAWAGFLSAVVACVLARCSPGPAGAGEVANAGPIAGVQWWLIAFTVLVWIDSALFFLVQRSPELRGLAWSTEERLWSNSVVHLGAGLVAGWALDRGLLRAVVAAAAVLVGVASLWFSQPGVPLLYIVGVSFYSAGLVRASAAGHGGRWRAAVLLGIAGWIGSALGIGMAGALGHTPAAFVLAAVGIVLLAMHQLGRGQAGGSGCGA